MTEFITRNYGNKEFEVIIKTDSEEHYKETQDFARKLIDHAKPQTNADRIRAMTDAQLVQMLTIGRGGFSCLKCAESEDCGQNCEVQCLKWLRQPAEEADNETVEEQKDGDGNG